MSEFMNGQPGEITVNIRQFGFTLAEVLITLAIIGIVAALTIPSLVANYQKKAYVTRLQKGIAVLNNGVKLMMAEEGVFNEEQLQANVACKKENGTGGLWGGLNSNDTSQMECINNYFSKYFKIVDYKKSLYTSDFYDVRTVKFLDGSDGKNLSALTFGGVYGFRTQDGAVFFPHAFTNTIGSPSPRRNTAVIDVNGPELPNQFGRDIFFLERKNGQYSVFGTDVWDDTSLSYTYCGDDSDKVKAGYACSGRIMAKGWKMDY